MSVFAWADVRVRLESDVPEAAGLVAHFADLTAEPDGPAQVVVRLSRTASGFRLTYPGGTARPRSWPAASLWLLEAVAHAYAQTTRHLVVHAGALVGRNGVVVFPGSPHAGKSSLAFAAWRMGLVVLGDDRVVLDGDAALAFPKCLKVRGRVRIDAPEGSSFRATMAGDRRLVIARSLPGFAGHGVRYPLGRVVVIERASRTTLTTIPLTKALVRLLPSAGLAQRTPVDLARTLKHHAEAGALPLLRVGEGDFERAVEILAEL